ncbi:Putative secreted protein [Sphingopyxis fribergensis]|uniref:Putative secreted protein n=1 Tax=Sphingopyxis fribergensis TaxID=1515612 RepID=A0A0A7PIE0_9SPHN|nr:hypothetical protein [Sphingopyxis fribergensis]AJA09760.1 Putative secreted protein [Sphingopyxis fribergensis]
MSPLRAVGAVALVMLTGLVVTADARERRHHGGGYHENYWEKRRDARRIGVVTGALATGVAGAVANKRVDDNYEECVSARSYGDYPVDCEEIRYREQRRGAVVTGVVAGRTARIIAN